MGKIIFSPNVMGMYRLPDCFVARYAYHFFAQIANLNGNLRPRPLLPIFLHRFTYCLVLSVTT